MPKLHKRKEELAEHEQRLSAKNFDIRANQVPGKASFENFNEIREYLKKGLEVYNNTVYSVDNIDLARNDLQVLKQIRTKLTEKRKSLEKAYKKPIEEVLSQLDELIDLVKVPYKIIDNIIKDNEKELKRKKIMTYANSSAYVLGKYAEEVINSPAFFNKRWENVSYRDKQWKADIDRQIFKAKDDIDKILLSNSEDIGAILGLYFDKLSLDGLENFLNTIERHKIENKTYSEPVFIDQQTGEVIETKTVIGEEQEREKQGEQESNIIQIIEEQAEEITEKHYVIRGNKKKIELFMQIAWMYELTYEELDGDNSKSQKES